jgi:16S rRNA (guanine527-N7)-methyltransferase
MIHWSCYLDSEGGVPAGQPPVGCQLTVVLDLNRRSGQMPTQIERFSRALSNHASDFAVHFKNEDIERLISYYELLMKWNSRLHLVAPCSPEEFATRHALESLLLLRHLPPDARVVDVGSGAGLPIIPCLIMRADLRATLIESSQKKTLFLREALRQVTSLRPPCLMVTRFEETSAPEADFVTCRAIDGFQQVLPKLIDWAPASSTLLLFSGPSLRTQIEGLLPTVQAELIPGSDQRFLIVARRALPTRPKQ